MTNEDKKLEQIIKSVQSPKGRYADHDAMFAELKPRLDKATPKQSLVWRRVAAAACVCLVIGVGIAGLYTYVVEDDNPLTSEVVTENTVQTSVEPMVFDQMPMSEIVEILSATYGVPIEISTSELMEYRVSACFDADESIEEVLAALATVGHCRWTRQGDSIVLY